MCTMCTYVYCAIKYDRNSVLKPTDTSRSPLLLSLPARVLAIVGLCEEPQLAPVCGLSRLVGRATYCKSLAPIVVYSPHRGKPWKTKQVPTGPQPTLRWSKSTKSSRFCFGVLWHEVLDGSDLGRWPGPPFSAEAGGDMGRGRVWEGPEDWVLKRF